MVTDPLTDRPSNMLTVRLCILTILPGSPTIFHPSFLYETNSVVMIRCVATAVDWGIHVDVGEGTSPTSP